MVTITKKKSSITSITRKSNQRENSQAEWLDLISAAAYLGKNPRFVRRLVSERRIRYFKHGRWLAFRRCDLDEWATSECIEPLR